METVLFREAEPPPAYGTVRAQGVVSFGFRRQLYA